MSEEIHSTHRPRPSTASPHLDPLCPVGGRALGADSQRHLIESKLDSVARAARRFARRHPDASVEVEDLVQEGNLALLQAVEDWVCGQGGGLDFHTFLSRRVHRALQRCVAQTEQECSLDERWDEFCQVEAAGELDLVDRLIYREHLEAMRGILGSLERKRRQVVALRFGLLDGRERTYKQIAEVMGFSGARAQQLMQAARKRLRHPLCARKLIAFFQDLDRWGR